MSVFITGTSGFIGNNLIEFLLSKGEKIEAISRKPQITKPGKDSQGHGQWRCHPGDIRDFQSLENAMKGCSTVYHLAGYARNWAKDSTVYYDTNVKGTENVLTAAINNKVEKVVVVSTSMVFRQSHNGKLINETCSGNGIFSTEYAHSKYLAERVVDKFVQLGLDVVIVNPTRVFGPGLLSEANSVTKMIQMYLSGRWRLVLGKGDSLGNYAYVGDVVRGLDQAMQFGRKGERYVLGGENLSYNQFFQILGETTSKFYRMIHIPEKLAMLISKEEKIRARYLKGYPLITPEWVKIFSSDQAFSSRKAQTEFGYRITPFFLALKQTIGWLQNERSEKTGRAHENAYQYS